MFLPGGNGRHTADEGLPGCLLPRGKVQQFPQVTGKWVQGYPLLFAAAQVWHAIDSLAQLTGVWEAEVILKKGQKSSCCRLLMEPVSCQWQMPVGFPQEGPVRHGGASMVSLPPPWVNFPGLARGHGRWSECRQLP